MINKKNIYFKIKYFFFILDTQKIKIKYEGKVDFTIYNSKSSSKNYFSGNY